MEMEVYNVREKVVLCFHFFFDSGVNNKNIWDLT